MELTTRNVKEIVRDPLSAGVTVALPVGLFLILQALGGVAGESSMLRPAMLVPGIALFGFAMMVFGSGFLLARDREDSLLARMLSTPLGAADFIVAYCLPYFLLAMFQVAALFGIGTLLGLRMAGDPWLVLLILSVMSVGYVGLGITLGALLSSKQVGFAYTAVLLPTIFSGAWFDLTFVGEGFRTAMNLLPFVHALDAAREVMVVGVGFAEIATDFLWVAGYSVVFLALGVFVFGRRISA